MDNYLYKRDSSYYFSNRENDEGMLVCRPAPSHSKFKDCILTEGCSYRRISCERWEQVEKKLDITKQVRINKTLAESRVLTTKMGTQAMFSKVGKGVLIPLDIDELPECMSDICVDTNSQWDFYLDGMLQEEHCWTGSITLTKDRKDVGFVGSFTLKSPYYNGWL